MNIISKKESVPEPSFFGIYANNRDCQNFSKICVFFFLTMKVTEFMTKH